VRVARPSQRSLLDPMVYNEFESGTAVRALCVVAFRANPERLPPHRWEVVFVDRNGNKSGMPCISSLTGKREKKAGRNRSDRAACAVGGGEHDLRLAGDTNCATC